MSEYQYLYKYLDPSYSLTASPQKKTTKKEPLDRTPMSFNPQKASYVIEKFKVKPKDQLYTSVIYSNFLERIGFTALTEFADDNIEGNTATFQLQRFVKGTGKWKNVDDSITLHADAGFDDHFNIRAEEEYRYKINNVSKWVIYVSFTWVVPSGK